MKTGWKRCLLVAAPGLFERVVTAAPVSRRDPSGGRPQLRPAPPAGLDLGGETIAHPAVLWCADWARLLRGGASLVVGLALSLLTACGGGGAGGDTGGTAGTTAAWQLGVSAPTGARVINTSGASVELAAGQTGLELTDRDATRGVVLVLSPEDNLLAASFEPAASSARAGGPQPIDALTTAEVLAAMLPPLQTIERDARDDVLRALQQYPAYADLQQAVAFAIADGADVAADPRIQIAVANLASVVQFVAPSATRSGWQVNPLDPQSYVQVLANASVYKGDNLELVYQNAARRYVGMAAYLLDSQGRRIPSSRIERPMLPPMSKAFDIDFSIFPPSFNFSLTPTPSLTAVPLPKGTTEQVRWEVLAVGGVTEQSKVLELLALAPDDIMLSFNALAHDLVGIVIVDAISASGIKIEGHKYKKIGAKVVARMSVLPGWAQALEAYQSGDPVGAGATVTQVLISLAEDVANITADELGNAALKESLERLLRVAGLSLSKYWDPITWIHVGDLLAAAIMSAKSHVSDSWFATINNDNVAIDPAVPPVLAVHPAQLTFPSTVNALPLHLSNSGGGTLQWTITSSASWLSSNVSQGQGSGEALVSVDRHALDPGSHNAFVTVSSNGGTMAVPVVVQVSAIEVIIE